ncbi:sugar phosphate isomerase/epimerase family protein [Falsiroseomonas sp. CW058]|uniref:sugar phosphate isomerase/epimerase family protein n=1 Tax=Falsiroseomonas sp. CW058 TaxID=3388664 RepID=UPI003D321437
MAEMRGPGVMLSQFMGDAAPFDSLDGVVRWLAGFGYAGVQVPVHDPRLIDLERAAAEDGYCRDYRARLADLGVEVTELAAHRAGQLVAVNPAFSELSDVFAAPAVRGDPRARTAWAMRQLRLAIEAAARLGLRRVATFSGAFAWPYAYPWPPPPPGLIDAAFEELARRWRPLLDHAESAGVDLCFELHPGEDLHDGTTFDRFLALVDGHRRARILFDPSHMLLQHMDYLGFIDLYADRIGAFHVKDAEFIRSPRSGVHGGFQDWARRPGRFRSPGDGQVDFAGVFSRLAAAGYDGWAVLEWECVLKRKEDGAREGAPFIRRHIIATAETPFDAALRRPLDRDAARRILGIGGE